MSKPVNVYDFDHTIYDGDASFDFIIYCMLRRPKTWRFLPGQLLAGLRYISGSYDRKQAKQAAFRFLCDINDIDKAVHDFWMAYENKIKIWYLNQKHSSDLIISASPDFLLEPIAEKLGLAAPIATIMDTRTGKITGRNCRGEEKVRRLLELNPEIKIENCYSDSLADMPLLKLAENAFIVKKHLVTALQVHIEERGAISQEIVNSKKALLREIFLYGLIGVSGATLDVILFKVFRTAGIPLLLANFMSVSISLAESFILNANYNFRKTDNLHKRATNFFAIGYCGWIVQSIILWLGVDNLRFQEIYVKVFAVLVAAIIQYVLNKFLTFRD